MQVSYVSYGVAGGVGGGGIQRLDSGFFMGLPEVVSRKFFAFSLKLAKASEARQGDIFSAFDVSNCY